MEHAKKDLENAKDAIQIGNSLVMDLMARGEHEKARVTLSDREWLQGLPIPPDLTQLLIAFYNLAIQALTPDSHGLCDVAEARKQCGRVADLMALWER